MRDRNLSILEYLADERAWWQTLRVAHQVMEGAQLAIRGAISHEDMERAYAIQQTLLYIITLHDAAATNPEIDGKGLLAMVPPPSQSGLAGQRIRVVVRAIEGFEA